MTRIATQSADRIESVDVQEITEHELPAHVTDLIEDYEDHVGERDRFLWKWIHVVLPRVTLSTVPPEYEDGVVDAKLVASMFVVLLDDVGERQHDRTTLREATKIPFEQQSIEPDRSDVDSEVLAVAERIWSQFEESIQSAPRHEEFLAILEFDFKQALVAIEYSSVVNETPEMANLDESWTHDSHNMMTLLYATTDLMFSPEFDLADLTQLRRTVWNAQQMARIGNWITTWEREVREGDFSSGVVVAALEQGAVTTDELYALRSGEGDPERVIDAIKDQDIEEQFLRKWRDVACEARQRESRTESVDLESYLDGMQEVMQFHLASRGLK